MLADYFSKSRSNPQPPQLDPLWHRWTHIQTDGDYTKRVVTPFGTTRLKITSSFHVCSLWAQFHRAHRTDVVVAHAWFFIPVNFLHLFVWIAFQPIRLQWQVEGRQRQDGKLESRPHEDLRTATPCRYVTLPLCPSNSFTRLQPLCVLASRWMTDWGGAGKAPDPHRRPRNECLDPQVKQTTWIHQTPVVMNTETLTTNANGWTFT